MNDLAGFLQGKGGAQPSMPGMPGGQGGAQSPDPYGMRQMPQQPPAPLPNQQPNLQDIMRMFQQRPQMPAAPGGMPPTGNAY